MMQGSRASLWLKGGVVFAVMAVGVFLGGLLALQPLLVVPFLFPVAGAALLWFALRTASGAMGKVARWEVYALAAFWILVINLPTFLAFDQTGFTRDHGLFNAQSIGRIALFGCVALAFLVFLHRWGQTRVLDGPPLVPPGGRLVLALYVWYLLNNFLVASGTSLLLATFRTLEWGLAVCLMFILFGLQTRRGLTAFEDRLRLIVPILVFLLASNLIVFPIRPSLIYQVSEVTGIGRFGGLFTHPNLLGVVAVLLFAYAWVYLSGVKRVVFSAIPLVVLLLTYSRGGYASFLIVCVGGGFVLLRHFGLKVVLILSAMSAAVALFYFPEVVEHVQRALSRGNERTGLTSLSERTAVWEAAKIMFLQSPWLGEGFISGPKRLGEVMLQFRLSTNFAAPHAHNELLQAQLSGGLVASALSLAVHLRVLYLLLKLKLLPTARFFGLSILTVVLVWGGLAPSLSYFLSLPGVLLIWLLLTLEGVPGRNISTRCADGTVVQEGACG